MRQGLLLLPFEIMAADTRKQIHLNMAVSAAIYIEERERMEKIKYFISWLGEKLFPDLPEKKRRRIAVQIIVGISLAFVCMAGMGIFRYKAVKQLEKYQAIADAYAQLDIILEEGREQSQKEAAAELEELFSEMEADAERYRQEYEAEMREKGLEAYDWDALCSENEDIKGWLCIPDTLINFPVLGTDDNAFYLSHDFTGDNSSAGCPFMDKDTQVWDFNRIIYGHNMGTGSDAMFSTLLKYEQEDYFKENQTIYFTDAYGSAAAYQVMAVVKYSIDDLEEWDFRTRNHEDMESYDAWMEQLQGRALYYEEPDHAPTSIITLATCDRRVFGKNGRFLVVAGKIAG
jgi:SrtB family sortase